VSSTTRCGRSANDHGPEQQRRARQSASSTFAGSPLGLAVQGDDVWVTQSENGTVQRVKVSF